MGGNRLEREVNFEVETLDWKGCVVLDLDGVLMRWVMHHRPVGKDVAEFASVLGEAREAGVGALVLTNRPPGQMAPLAYEMGMQAGLWVTESGGSVYSVSENKSFVAPKWKGVVDRVEQLRSWLQTDLGVERAPVLGSSGAQFEPGMGYVKTVLVPPRGVEPNVYASGRVEPFLERRGISEFEVKAGKGVDIDPAGLSKAGGMELLLEINGIDPEKMPVLWVADHKRDVAAAEVLVERGGRVAAVGNADAEYMSYVQEAGGLVAPSETSYHGSAAWLLKAFIIDQEF